MPLTGDAIAVDDAEVRKEGARLELTEPLRDTVGEAASGEGVHSQGAARPEAKLGRCICICRGWNRCRGDSDLPYRDGLYGALRRSRERTTCPWVSQMEGGLC